MKTPLHEKILRAIQRETMLRAGERLGVAVSGGADSVALLRILEDLRSELGVTLCVLHFHHQLRGTDANEDQRFVESLARASGLEFFCASADVRQMAREHRWNLEDAARRARYEYFERILAEGTARWVATAHTADDQAETVLARILRGTGPGGLISIRPIRGRIIRPLLFVRRQDLRNFLSQRGQPWREDATNLDTSRLRARVRHQLIPHLEDTFSPAIVERLCGLAELARDEEAFWSALVEERLKTLVSRSRSGLSLAADGLWRPAPFSHRPEPQATEFSPALARRLIRRIHAEVSAERGQLSRQQVQDVIEFARKSKSGRRLCLPGNVEIIREFGQLVFRNLAPTQTRNAPQGTARGAPAYQYTVEIPRSGCTTIVSIPELGRSYSLKVIDWPLGERDTIYYGRVLDPERLRAPLVLRNWRPGDGYLPCGRRQPRKLNRMFSARRISVTKRSLWPVLTSAGRVAWADQMPAAAEFSPRGNAHRALLVVEEGGSGEAAEWAVGDA